MPDNLTPAQRRKTMAAVKGANTSLEVTVDAAFKAKGWKYARNCSELPGKPDFVFADHRLVVFVDGDFWHGWRFPRWKSKLPKYWKKKIDRNRRRDCLNFRRLRRNGWKVLRIWEHQVHRDLAAVVARVEKGLRQGRKRSTSSALGKRRGTGRARLHLDVDATFAVM